MENIKNKDEFLFLMRKVFPFAYNLYGDDLAAQELISDSLHRLILKDDKLVSDITWKELISSMYFLINRNFKLAEKVSGAFSRLSLVEKAILTLVHNYKIEILETSKILDLQVGEGFGHLNSARAKVLAYQGRELNIDEIGY